MPTDDTIGKRTSRVCRAFLLIGLVCTGSGTHAATLAEIATRALARSPEILARQHAYNVAGYEEAEPRTYGQGALLLQGRMGYVQEDPYGSVEGGDPLPADFPRLQQVLEEDASPPGEDASTRDWLKAARRFELLRSVDEVGLSAALAYVEVLRQRRLSGLSQEDWNACRDVYDHLLGASGTSRGELLEASGCVARAQSVWLADTSRLQDFSLRFERVVGEPPPMLVDVPDLAAWLPPPAEAWQRAQQASPALQAGFAQLWIASVHADVRQRPRTGIPRRQPSAAGGLDMHYRGKADRLADEAAFDAENTRKAAERYQSAEAERDDACRQTRAALSDLMARSASQQARFAQLRTEERDGSVSSGSVDRGDGRDKLPDQMAGMGQLGEIRRSVVNARFDLLITQLQILAVTHRLLPALGSVTEAPPPQKTHYAAFLLCKP